QVNAVEQRTGKLGAVALYLFRRAPTASGRIAEIAAGAGVHGGDQLEAGREAHLVARPGDHDLATFQGLAKGFQHLAVELRQFVEKEHPLVRQADLARSRPAAATDQRRAGGTVVGLAEGPGRPAAE